MPEQPLVTILSLCYNTGPLVIEALECIQRQSYKNIQLIIVDDCSSDNSVQLIENWLANHPAPANRTLLVNQQNKGIPGVFNAALPLVQGNYLTWISDDLWDDDRIEKTVRLFEALPEKVGVLFGDSLVFGDGIPERRAQSPYETLIGLGYPRADLFRKNEKGFVVLDGKTVHEALFCKCFFAAPSVTVRTAIYRTIGPYDDQVQIEDLDCWFRASAHFDFVYQQEPTVHYRLHAQNFSSGRSERYMDSLQSILRRHVAAGCTAQERAAAKRHIREEAYRTALGLAKSKMSRMAFRSMRRYYLPNFQWTSNALKETVKLSLALCGSLFGKS